MRSNLFHRRFTEQGAPPGSIAPGEESLAPKISVLAYDKGTLNEEAVESVEDLPDLSGDGTVTWIDIQGHGDGTFIQRLGERLGLHPLAISDVVNVGQRPKVDQYDGVLFVVLRMVILNQDNRLHWEQVSLFLGKHYVVTIQETHEDCLEPLRNRIRAGRQQVRSSGADYLATAVIDGIVDGYFPVLEYYGDCLELLEEEILADRHRDVLPELYRMKRDLAGFRRATWPLREALAHLMRTDEVALSKTARLHLRDTLDHTMQVVEVNESYRELSASLVDVFLSMVGQRTNDVMRVLTVVSAIFIPLTFVAGIYGMNFDTTSTWNLPELRWRFGYPVFWIVCLMIGSTLLLLFRRLGWLKR